MTKSLGINTIVALQDASTSGLVVRDFMTVWAKDRSTGAEHELNVWTGDIPVTVSVDDPTTGSTDSRDYQAMGTLLNIAPIPAGMATEVRTIRVQFSKLSDVASLAVRTYNVKMARVQIHRGIFDPGTRRLVDPPHCRFIGYINSAPVKTPKSSGQGTVEIECVSTSRILTKVAGTLFSMETLKLRSGDLFGKYLDVAGAWRIWWGQEEKAISEKEKPKEHYLR